MVKNCIPVLEKNENDAEEMIKYMQKLKSSGIIEYLTYGLTEESARHGHLKGPRSILRDTMILGSGTVLIT